MQAGKMRERITFQRRTEAVDAAGNVEGDWEDIVTVRARLQPVAPRASQAEVVIAQRLQGQALFELQVRYSRALRDLTPDCRAVDARNSSRVFNVRSVLNPDERRMALKILVEQGVATG